MKPVPNHRPALPAARITILPLSAMLLTSCNMPRKPQTSPPLRCDEASFDYWKEVDEMIPLEQEVGLVLEAKDVNHFCKFEEFHVAPNPETGKIELLATPRTSQSIAMRFTITVLEQRFVL